MSIVGARAVSVIANLRGQQGYIANPGDIFAIWHGGLSSYGGLLGGVPTGPDLRTAVVPAAPPERGARPRRPGAGHRLGAGPAARARSSSTKAAACRPTPGTAWPTPARPANGCRCRSSRRSRTRSSSWPHSGSSEGSPAGAGRSASWRRRWSTLVRRLPVQRRVRPSPAQHRWRLRRPGRLPRLRGRRRGARGMALVARPRSGHTRESPTLGTRRNRRTSPRASTAAPAGARRTEAQRSSPRPKPMWPASSRALAANRPVMNPQKLQGGYGRCRGTRTDARRT